MIQFRYAERAFGEFPVRFVVADKSIDRLLREDGRIVFEAGIEKKPSTKKLISVVRGIIAIARKEKANHISIDLDGLPKLPISPKAFGALLAQNAEVANYEYVRYKTPPKDGWKFVETITILGKVSAPFKAGVLRGGIIGEEINRTRSLANTPGGDMTPELLAKAAEDALKGTKATVEVLGTKEMEKLGMGGILGVGKGSDAPPRFIVIDYAGAKTKKPIVLVGKGVTFDTGGLNLKPGNSINEMHMDMSGGAAVIHALAAIAKLKLKTHVIGLIPAAENMPSGSSYRPGDVLRSMSGVTIEIGNTDAEGRVILADALTYAKRYTPRLVVDVATLTGAACVALGNKCSALFTKSDVLAEKFLKLGEETGDRLWRLPLWEEYDDDIRGTFGDWSNTGRAGSGGGAITAAAFLEKFAKDYPWVHLDIAPRMTTIEGDRLAKGASGTPVALLVRLLEAM